MNDKDLLLKASFVVSLLNLKYSSFAGLNIEAISSNILDTICTNASLYQLFSFGDGIFVVSISEGSACDEIIVKVKANSETIAYKCDFDDKGSVLVETSKGVSSLREIECLSVVMKPDINRSNIRFNNFDFSQFDVELIQSCLTDGENVAFEHSSHNSFSFDDGQWIIKISKRFENILLMDFKYVVSEDCFVDICVCGMKATVSFRTNNNHDYLLFKNDTSMNVVSAVVDRLSLLKNSGIEFEDLPCEIEAMLNGRTQ